MNHKDRKEKVLLNKKTNFFYIERGVERTPAGSEVQIVTCNPGIQTIHGILKGTIAQGLRNLRGQMIAYSYDVDDLLLFALEHNWIIDDPIFRQLVKS